MPILTTIWLLIKICYPSQDIDQIRAYNQGVNDAMARYCFLDIEFEYTTNSECADLIIYPCTDFYYNPANILGLTTGSYLANPKVFGTPYIQILDRLLIEHFALIMTHEIGHFLGLQHSIDPNSLMYHETDGKNNQLTRTDSLTLLKLYKKI